MKKHGKLKIWLSLALSVFGVSVTATTTFAWFQINTTSSTVSDNHTVKTGSPNLTIDNSNVTGYKVNHVIGADGFLDRTSSSVVSKKGQTYNTTNNNNEVADVVFDVPEDGLGYYLVKKNPSGSYKYTYDHVKYNRRFEEYSSMNLRAVIDASFCTFTTTDKLRIRHYSYDSTNYKTVNQQVLGLSIDSNSTSYCSFDPDNNEISITRAGTYRVWLYIYNSIKTVTLEPMGEASKMNAWTADPATSIEPEHTTGTVDTTDYTLITINNTDWNAEYRTLQIYNLTYTGGYTHGDLEYFLTTFYGSQETGTWSYTRIDKGWKRTGGSEGDYTLAADFRSSGGYLTGDFYLPSWISYCEVGLKNSLSSWVYFNYLNNLRQWVQVDNGSWGGSISNAVGNHTTIYARNVYNNLQFKIDGNNNPTTNSSKSFDTHSIITKYVDSNGNNLDCELTGLNNSSDIGAAYIKVNQYAVPSNPTVPNGYTFTGWKYSRTNDWSNKLDTSAGSKLRVEDGFTLYAVFAPKSGYYGVAFIPSYFVTNNDNSLTHLSYTSSDTGQAIQRAEVVSGGSLPSKTFSNSYVRDDTNSIFYYFTRSDDNNVFYTTSACTTRFTGTITANTKVYVKMVCPKLYTFYMESQSSPIVYGNCYIHAWGSGWHSNEANGQAMNTTGLPAYRVTTMETNYYLYRTSLPTSLTGFIIFDGTSGGTHQTRTISSEFVDNAMIQLGGGDDYGNRYWGWRTTVKSSLGTAYVQKYKGSGDLSDANNWEIIATMDTGDGTINDFIYEKGVVIDNNSIVRIAVTTNGGTSFTYHGYSSYISTNKAKHTYATTYDSGNSIKLTNYANSDGGKARFNFYLTHSGGVSIAMVPYYGNGYYIMDYNSTLGTDNFINATRMDSNDYSAIYVGYYSAGGSGHQIFIRSYLDAVDVLSDTLTSATTTGGYAEISSGVITISASGWYIISVTNKTIDISPYQVNDFFTTNYLDYSLVTTTNETTIRQSIYDQRTTLIIEVPFVCNNAYASSISLITESTMDYVGASLYVSENPLGTGATLYSTLRGGTNTTISSYYSGLTDVSSSTPKSNLNTNYLTVAANSSATHYAYIIIDYLTSVNSSDLTSDSPPSIVFYLQATQV